MRLFGRELLKGLVEGQQVTIGWRLDGQFDAIEVDLDSVFQQADEVTSTLSSASERSADTAFSVSAGNEVDESLLLIMAPLGIGTAAPAVGARASTAATSAASSAAASCAVSAGASIGGVTR